MFALILYFVFGFLVIQYEKPVQFAAAFAVMASLLSLVFGDSLMRVLLSGAILFAYTGFVYMVADRYADKVLPPIGVLVAGALILVGASFVA